jgi:hypothetical protein
MLMISKKICLNYWKIKIQKILGSDFLQDYKLKKIKKKTKIFDLNFYLSIKVQLYYNKIKK